MIQRIANRLHNEEKGFTLIELMVVVLIIAILIAIAIPTFLGARRRAQDRAAQSSLRNTVTAAKAIFTDDETYTPADASALQAGEPSLVYEVTPGTAVTTSDEPIEIVIITHAADEFRAVSYSKAGKCWFIRDIAGPEGVTGAGTFWAVNDDETSCTSGTSPGTFVREPGTAVSP